jgi:hypothetical protein
MTDRLLPVRCMTFAALLGAALVWGWSVAAQTQASPAAAPVTSAFTRPCSANPVLPMPKSKKWRAHKSKHPLPQEALPACLEVQGEALEIQEFLQDVARQQAWPMGDNQISEDMWSFVRYLNADEVEKYAYTKVSIEPVDFTSGKAAVIVRATDIGGGYARVQISANIEGQGRSADREMAQPITEWQLKSKGVLEQELVTELRTNYRPLE